MISDLACVVVLYNPIKKYISRIVRYTAIFKKVIVIDNSETTLKDFCNRDVLEYIPLKKNMGIAYALNLGIKRAKEMNFEWVMTIDQDSIVSKRCINQLYETVQSVTDDRIAMITAVRDPDKLNQLETTEYVDYTISSGSVVNTYVFDKLGGFDNNLFIDVVDFEYCLRLNVNGYKILQDNRALFNHCIGNPMIINKTVCYNYPPFRYYYILRNSLIIMKKYEKNIPGSVDLEYSIKQFIKPIIYEDNADLKQLYTFIAILDYLHWLKTGKYYCHIDKIKLDSQK